MTRHFTASLVVVFCGSFLLPSVSVAGGIFTNFGAGQSYDITQGNIVGNDFVIGDNLAEGDTFTPSATATFGSLDIALSCFIASCPDPFTVALTQDSGSNSPGTVIESFTDSGTVLGQLNVNNAPLVFNSVSLPTLTVGTQYWITVSSDVTNSIAWNLNTTSDPSDQALSPDGGSSWLLLGAMAGAYEVDGVQSTATPEPGTFWLLAGILSVYFFRRFRLRRRA